MSRMVVVAGVVVVVLIGALFLLSSRASWVNGVDLKVDGGFHALRTLAGRG